MTGDGVEPRLDGSPPETSDESVEAHRQRLRRAWFTGAPPDTMTPKAGMATGLVTGVCVAALIATGFGVSGVLRRDLAAKPVASMAAATAAPTLRPVATPLPAPARVAPAAPPPTARPAAPTATPIPAPGSPSDAFFLANGDTTDAFGDWAPLTWSEFAEYGAGPPGQGQAFRFDGTNGLSETGGLGDFPSGNFYIEFDILTRVPAAPASPDAGAYDVLANDGPGGGMSLQVYVWNDGRVIAEIGPGPIPAQYYTVSVKRVNDGVWHHVLVRRASGHLCVVIDRSNQNISCAMQSGTTEDSAITNPGPFTVGAFSSTEGQATGSGPVRTFVGMIDNLYLGVDPLG